MSAVNSLQPPQPPDKRPSEPSMEEILASIRRIIADDQSLPRAESAEPVDVVPASHGSSSPPEPVPIHVLHPVASLDLAQDDQSDATVRHHEQALTLAEAMARGSISAPQYAGLDGLDHAATHLAPEASPVPTLEPQSEPAIPALPEPEEAPPVTDQDSHADSNGAAPIETGEPHRVISTVTQHSVVSAFNTLAAARLASNSEELRAMAKDMLRPLLLTWLDDNLPALVERLVREEIERVVHGH